MILTGFKPYYKNGPYNIAVGNGFIFPDLETAQIFAENYPKIYRWFKDKIYIMEVTFSGLPATPCRTLNGRRVYNRDYLPTLDALRVGDYIEAEIVNDLMNCMPPACYRSDCMQAGEPFSHETDPETGRGRATFTTFKRENENTFIYCGHCFRGTNTEV